MLVTPVPVGVNSWWGWYRRIYTIQRCQYANEISGLRQYANKILPISTQTNILPEPSNEPILKCSNWKKLEKTVFIVIIIIAVIIAIIIIVVIIIGWGLTWSHGLSYWAIWFFHRKACPVYTGCNPSICGTASQRWAIWSVEEYHPLQIHFFKSNLRILKTFHMDMIYAKGHDKTSLAAFENNPPWNSTLFSFHPTSAYQGAFLPGDRCHHQHHQLRHQHQHQHQH